MCEGTIVLIRENVLSKRISQPARVRWHWFVHLIALALNGGGLGVVVYRSRGSPHFTSTHGLSGFIATVLAAVVCLNGFMTLFNVELRKFIKPNLNKLIHASLGIAAIGFGIWGTITGYRTRWFTSRVGQTGLHMCYALTSIICFWMIVRPLINGFTRIKNMVT